MRNKIWEHCLLLLFVLCSVFYACESNEGTLKGKNHSLLFFNALGADFSLQRIVCSLEQKNNSTDFISEFIETYGYPLWKDAVAFFEGECFTYAVPIKDIMPNSEINAIWFFVMNDSCTNYHVYTREMAEMFTQQMGEEIEQTWMFDYFTFHTLHKEPTSGLKFEPKPMTRTTQVAMECENTVRVEGTTIEVDVHCWSSGGSGNSNQGDVNLSGSGSVEEPRPSPSGGGGGNGGGNNGSGSSTIAPKASKLFRSMLLPAPDWKILEERINKIILDCMGGTLYNALIAKGKINIKFTSDASSYNPSTNTIYLNNKKESNQLFHEMWHAYQFSKTNVKDFNNSTINYEIEAHYAQYLYLKKLKEYV